jgi:hypothetical protein
MPMKLSHKDLKTLYRSSSAGTTNDESACPSVDFLMSSFLPETSEEDKLRVADHVAGCHSCRAKFELAREILSEASRLTRESEAVELTEAEAAALRQKAAAKLREMGKRPKAGGRKDFSETWRTFFFRYRYASVAVGAVMIVAAILLVLRAPQIKDTGAMRGEAGAALVLATPRGIQKALPLHFEWQPYPGAKTYEVKVLDGKLDVFWTSGRIRTTSLNLPSGPTEGLKKGNVYYWKVSAFSDGEMIQESNLQSFQLPE